MYVPTRATRFGALSETNLEAAPSYAPPCRVSHGRILLIGHKHKVSGEAATSHRVTQEGVGSQTEPASRLLQASPTQASGQVTLRRASQFQSPLQERRLKSVEVTRNPTQTKHLTTPFRVYQLYQKHEAVTINCLSLLKLRGCRLAGGARPSGVLTDGVVSWNDLTKVRFYKITEPLSTVAPPPSTGTRSKTAGSTARGIHHGSSYTYASGRKCP